MAKDAVDPKELVYQKAVAFIGVIAFRIEDEVRFQSDDWYGRKLKEDALKELIDAVLRAERRE